MPTVEVLADVFYTEEGIYSTDPTNVIRDRFIEDILEMEISEIIDPERIIK